MPTIKNENYKQFLENGVINTLNEDTIYRALENIKGRYTKEARALLICLYYTGGRPTEVIKLKGNDITKDGAYLVITLSGAKNGLTRPVHLSINKPLVKELADYSKGVMPLMYLFFHFRGGYSRKVGDKVYIEDSYKLRYYIKKWFGGVLDINPYYLRHNRFSKMIMAGASTEEIRVFKGAKSIDSVAPYLHLNTKGFKKLARKIE